MNTCYALILLISDLENQVGKWIVIGYQTKLITLKNRFAIFQSAPLIEQLAHKIVDWSLSQWKMLRWSSCSLNVNA